MYSYKDKLEQMQGQEVETVDLNDLVKQQAEGGYTSYNKQFKTSVEEPVETDEQIRRYMDAISVDYLD